MNLPLKLKGVALAALVATLVAACASSSPAPVLLTLPPVMATSGTAATAAGESAAMLAVRRVNIPEYLVARRVRYRSDVATLAEWPNTYWAERIEIGVSREFVSALRQQLPGWTVCDTNCGEKVPTLTLQVDLASMDFLRSAQKLQSRARITLIGASAPMTVINTKEFGADIPVGADTAQGHAQAITALIERVAADTVPMIRNARR